VVVLVTLSTTNLGLLFLHFLRIDIEFTSHWSKPQNWEESFSTRPPKTFKTFTNRPLVPPLDTMAMANSPAARWGTGWQTSDGGLRLGSPVIDWWRWIGWGSRRRAAAVAQRQRGCGSSDGGEGRGGAQQCAASGASMWPREETRLVTGRGGSAEGRARWWRSGGGHGSSGSGDRAARLGQQATRGAFVMHREELRGLRG
jgi:hypothetical protein